jgi:hypothetical protein
VKPNLLKKINENLHILDEITKIPGIPIWVAFSYSYIISK